MPGGEEGGYVGESVSDVYFDRKSFEEWMSILPPELVKVMKENMKEENRETIRMHEPLPFNSLVNCHATWRGTPQGGEFWGNIPHPSEVMNLRKYLINHGVAGDLPPVTEEVW